MHNHVYLPRHISEQGRRKAKTWLVQFARHGLTDPCPECLIPQTIGRHIFLQTIQARPRISRPHQAVNGRLRIAQ